MNDLFDVFDRSLHATHVWIDDIGDDMGVDAQESYYALKAVLHALRDHLPMDKSAQLAAHLPTHVRGIYYSEWKPSSKSSKTRSKKKFTDSVKKSLEDTDSADSMDAEDACRAIFRMLSHHVGSDELSDARASLTKNVQKLWSEPDGDEEKNADKKTGKQKKSEDRNYGTPAGGPQYTPQESYLQNGKENRASENRRHARYRGNGR